LALFHGPSRSCPGVENEPPAFTDAEGSIIDHPAN